MHGQVYNVASIILEARCTLDLIITPTREVFIDKIIQLKINYQSSKNKYPKHQIIISSRTKKNSTLFQLFGRMNLFPRIKLGTPENP